MKADSLQPTASSREKGFGTMDASIPIFPIAQLLNYSITEFCRFAAR
jgi:hypothetical protein